MRYLSLVGRSLLAALRRPLTQRLVSLVVATLLAMCLGYTALGIALPRCAGEVAAIQPPYSVCLSMSRWREEALFSPARREQVGAYKTIQGHRRPV
jgi:hypothetical protein